MEKVSCLVRLDPEQGGIGYFDAFLEDSRRDALIAEHFQFLGMKLVSVGTFAADYSITFRSDDFLLEVFNDDPDVYPKFGVSDDWDHVVFAVSGPDVERVQAILRRVTDRFEAIMVSGGPIGLL